MNIASVTDPEILSWSNLFICSKDCNVMEKLTIIADEVCQLNKQLSLCTLTFMYKPLT